MYLDIKMSSYIPLVQWPFISRYGLILIKKNSLNFKRVKSSNLLNYSRGKVNLSNLHMMLNLNMFDVFLKIVAFL